MTLRVAICQPNVIMGGRYQVILGITQVLNEAGIVPDLLTRATSFDLESTETRYGHEVQLRLRRVPMPNLPQDAGIIMFLGLLRRYQADYDLFINTSNSLIFLPGDAAVLSYMFYPRRSRIMIASPDIHQPDERVRLWTKVGIQKAVLRQIYRLSRPHPAHHIVCMTKFTRNALCEAYPDLPRDLPIVYPAVDTSAFQAEARSRTASVISVGRFHPNKRQFEQIKLAEKLPDVPFHMAGFVNAPAYYQQCEDYMTSRELSNVHLHPNIPFEAMIALLQSSKYFLHTMINEPFGLTAVQAIAAGCVPLVHDSGGQKETIPIPELRYQSLDEVPAMLERLESMPASEIDAIVQKLQGHVRTRFDETVFHQQMRDILLPILSRIEAESAAAG